MASHRTPFSRAARSSATLLGCALALTVGACGSSKPSPGASSASVKSCSKADLSLHSPGVLTVATDQPAYPPYFEHNKPANGEGFESAVAYAIGKQLGFGSSEVKWTSEPFDASYAPGPKSFDFDINEVSITPARAKEVDFSSPYYTNPQAVLVAKGSRYANVSSLSELKGAEFGVQIGTTSLASVESSISPSNQPKVFNNSNDVVTALREKQVDAIVVDLATAFQLAEEDVPGGKIVGQFSAPGGDRWGVLLAKESSLTHCVNDALTAMRSDGALQRITDRWMATGAGVPKLG